MKGAARQLTSHSNYNYKSGSSSSSSSSCCCGCIRIFLDNDMHRGRMGLVILLLISIVLQTRGILLKKRAFEARSPACRSIADIADLKKLIGLFIYLFFTLLFYCNKLIRARNDTEEENCAQTPRCDTQLSNCLDRLWIFTGNFESLLLQIFKLMNIF